MTLSEFISKYNGQKVDFDGKHQGQCVDLFRQYAKEVLDQPQPKGVIGAADFWTNFGSDPNLNQYFTKINNTPEFIPEPGDVMVWNKNAGNGYGHIGIVKAATKTNFVSFDQNWKQLSVCELIPHVYNNVYGVLRPKASAVMSVMHKGLDLTNQESMKVAVDIWDEVMVKKLWVKLAELKELFDVTNKKTIVEAISEVGNRLEQIGRLKEQLTTEAKLRIELATSLSGCEDAVRVYENDIVARNATINEQAKRIGKLLTEIATLKDALNKPESERPEEKPESISKNSTLEQVIAWIKNLIFSNKN